MGAWVITATTPVGRELTVTYDDRIVTDLDPMTPEGFLIARRLDDPDRPVRATHTGPFAAPSIDGDEWVVFCTVFEAFAEWVSREDIHVDGAPSFPDFAHTGAVF